MRQLKGLAFLFPEGDASLFFSPKYKTLSLSQVLSEHFPGVELAHDIRSLQSLPEVRKKKKRKKRRERRERREDRRRLKSVEGWKKKRKKLTSLSVSKKKLNSGDRPRRRGVPLRGRLSGGAQGRARREGVGAGAISFISFLSRLSSSFFRPACLSLSRSLDLSLSQASLKPLSSVKSASKDDPLLSLSQQSNRSSTSSAS